ncbi:hypothetical protein ILP92_15410 [Maribius pontilimi]|uniref:Uncharacterized protein n=1 Tax=Palleronia pontilimi TaxID=1964209 RepID=A0A934IBM0_9RHOB|nr:hypothetical protein [Palleronia pontilimi]MBJ3764138.1 hypothetical protein [Palleronia pontilimi]
MIYGFLTVVVAIAVLAATDLNPVRKLLANRRAAKAETDEDLAVALEGADPDADDETDPVMSAVERAIGPEDLDDEADDPAPYHLRDEDPEDAHDSLAADEGREMDKGDDEDFADEDFADEDDGFDIENLFDAEVLNPGPDDRFGRSGQDAVAVEAASSEPIHNNTVDLFSSGTRVDRDTSPPVIDDYDPSEDQLVVVFDSDTTPEPEISIDPVTGSADVFVLLNGQPVMLVRNAPDLAAEDIELIETDLAEDDADHAAGPSAMDAAAAA